MLNHADSTEPWPSVEDKPEPETQFFAICYTTPGTLTPYWLNRLSWGGCIWSLVRTPREATDVQAFMQPALRFTSIEAAEHFIADYLKGNWLARVAPVQD